MLELIDFDRANLEMVSGVSPAAGWKNSRSHRELNIWTSNIERSTLNVQYWWRCALSFLDKQN